MVSEFTTKPSLRRWIRIGVALLLALTLVALISGIINLGIVPTKYYWLLAIYLAVSGVVLWYLLGNTKYRRNNRLQTALIATALVLSGINVYGIVVARSTNNLFSGVQNDATSYVDYVIIAPSERKITVDSAQNIAIISDADPLYRRASEVLRDETPAQQKPVGHLADVVNALANNETDLAAIRKESLPLIQDQDAQFAKNLTVLGTFHVEDTTHATPNTLDANKPYALYISGIDTYGDIATVSRSDVNMLVVMHPQDHTMLLVNTPRDYYVQLYGTTGVKDKLTHAGIYGVDMSRQTMEDLYGLDIPYYLRINFTSLTKVIDAVGPIDVYSDYDFKSYRKGYNTLDSKRALEFARERHSFEEGDRQRGRNQQYVIEAIVAKMAKSQNAVRLPRIINSIRGAVDTNMSPDSLKSIAYNQLDDIRSWKVTSISVDGTGAMLPTYSYGGSPLYVMVPDEASLTNARQQISKYLK